MSSEELVSILERMGEIQGRMVAAQEQQGKKIDGLCYAIHGNGTPGIKTLVDRHDQWIETRRWRDRLLIGAAVSGIISTALSAIVVLFHIPH